MEILRMSTKILCFAVVLLSGVLIEACRDVVINQSQGYLGNEKKGNRDGRKSVSMLLLIQC